MISWRDFLNIRPWIIKIHLISQQTFYTPAILLICSWNRIEIKHIVLLLYYSQHFLRKVLEILSLEVAEWFDVDVFLETERWIEWSGKVRHESHDRKIGICLFWVFLLLIYKNKFYLFMVVLSPLCCAGFL